MDPTILALSKKCTGEYYALPPKRPDIGTYMGNCMTKKPLTTSFGQSVQIMAGRTYGALPSRSDLYNALPDVSGRARTFYMNNINTDQNGNPIGYRPEPDANGHRGGKRRTKKSKGAKKSRKGKGGKRKGRKSRRHN